MIDVARTPLGRIAVERKALAQLVQGAAERADGVRIRTGRSLRVDVAENGTPGVALALSAPHGAVLSELARRVQERVGEVLRATLGAAVVRVDITVAEIHQEGGR